jgi:hypothetical protein
MIYLFIGLLLFLSCSPVLLVFSKKIIRKKLYFFSVLFFLAQPISTIILPLFFNPILFDGVLINYLILMSLYYFFILVTYMFFLKFIPISFNSLRTYSENKKGKLFYLVMILSLLLFSVLVVHSDGVFLYDPRYGYQHYREGVGFVWVLYISSVAILFYFICIRSAINTKKILFFILLMFLTGSKKLILDVFLKCILVYLWSNKKIKKWQIFLGAGVLVILMLKLFDQFGASQGFLVRASTYFDFMELASLVFTDLDNGVLEHTYGSITLSSFWQYIPRSLYPDKPYAYGPVTLVEIYFPGMAETGHTPSFGMLTSEFVDFGWFASIFSIIFNLSLLVQIFSIIVVSTNANLNKRWTIGALLFILCPGFGFHLPILFTIVLAFMIVPSLFVSSRGRSSEK